MKHRGTKLLSLLLVLTLLVGLMPGMSLTAWADWSGTAPIHPFNASSSGDPLGSWQYGFPVSEDEIGKITKIEVLIYMESIADSGWGQVVYSRGEYGTADREDHTALFENRPGIQKYTAGTGTIADAKSAVVQLIGKGQLLAYTISFDGGAPKTEGDWTYPVCIFPGEVTATVGQTLADVPLTNQAGNTPGTWTWADPVITSVGPEGTNVFKANFIPTDSSYKPVNNVEVTVTVKAGYTITWKNGDGTVLKTDTVPYGATPSYNGPTPTKASDAQYTYTHSGWSPEITPAKADAIYTAVFTATPMEPDKPATFTVTYKPGEGSGAEKRYTHNVGETHNVEGNFFTAPEGKTFDDWQGSDGKIYKVGAPVTGNLTLTAQWKDEGEQGGSADRVRVSGDFDIVFIGGGFGGGAAESWDYAPGVAPQRAWKVSLAPMVNGSAALGLSTGESGTEMNVYPNTAIYVFPSANPGFTLDKIIWSLIDGSASYDITEAKNFVMPAMDAVVYVTFKPAG